MEDFIRKEYRMNDFDTVVELIKDIDFQKTQLLYNLHDMFDFDNNYDLQFDLNPFCNNIYFYDGEYTIDVIETKEEFPNMFLFNEYKSGKQLLETPSFEDCETMFKNDKYVAIKNRECDWLITRVDSGKIIIR